MIPTPRIVKLPSGAIAKGIDTARALWHSSPMNKPSTDRRTQLVAALVEGNSIRSTARMTDVAFNTVLKFVVDIGKVCRTLLDERMRNLACRRLQADEIWQFC